MKRLVACTSALAIALMTSVASAGTVERSEASGRPVRVFVPSTPAAPPAAVLMLHGCTQDADGFAAATKMDEVAEENGFYAIYIEQPTSIVNTACFRWWDPNHQTRGKGEPKEIADAVSAVVTDKGIDPERVYVAGLSAGAAMSVILGATYPDRFAAVGVLAGTAYRSATSLNATFGVGQTGDVDADALGDAAKAAMGDAARVVPVLVMHGTKDGVLVVENGRKVAAQWVRTNGALLEGDTLAPPTTVTGEAGGYPTTTITHRTAGSHAVVVELVLVENLGHAWPGGKEGGSYADSRGPDASRAFWSFFAPRTRSAPLPAGPPPGTPGASSSSGDPSGSSSGSDDPATSSGEGPGGAASGGDGGCATSPSRADASLALLGASVLALAASRARRRRA